MKKLHVKIIAVILALLLLFTALCIAPYTKLGMFTTVRLWENHLTAFAEKCLLEKESSYQRHIGYTIGIFPDSACVFFSHIRLKDTGFFYSASGAPVGYQGEDDVFEKLGDGWLWEEGIGSDNWMYVEHIVGNWFWYEMHF